MGDLKENTQKKIMEKLVLSAALGMFCYCSNNVTMGMKLNNPVLETHIKENDEKQKTEQNKETVSNKKEDTEKKEVPIKKIEQMETTTPIIPKKKEHDEECCPCCCCHDKESEEDEKETKEAEELNQKKKGIKENLSTINEQSEPEIEGTE